jgi:hypothetical protein
MPCTLLVVSDTHGELGPLKKVLKARSRKADAIIHLGDGVDDLERLRMSGMGIIGWEAVRGNSDRDTHLPLLKFFEAGGKRILLVHGHLFGVNEGPGRVVDAARSAGADAVFYGHAHRAFWEEYGGLLALCPGSLARPRDGRTGSYAMVRIGPSGAFDVEILRLG